MPSLIALVHRHFERLIFYTVFFSCAYFYQGANPNTNSRFDLARSMVLQGTLRIDTYAANTVDKAFRDGHYYSDKAPGVAFASAGVMALVSPALERLDLTRRVKDNAYLIFIGLTLLAGFTAYTAVRFYRLAFLVTENQAAAAAVTLVTFLCTFVLPYATILFSHQITGNLLFLVFDYIARSFFRSKEKQSPFLPLTFAALVALVEFPAAGAALFFSAWIIFKEWKRFGALLLIPGIAVAIMLGVYNYLAFGNPFSLGYGNLAQTPFDAAMQQGFFGVKLPRLDRLPQLLFYGYRGLFYYNPVLLFALAGLGFAWRQYGWRLVVGPIGCFLYFLLVNMSYNFWQGGACIGPRHMVPVIPLLAAGFFFLPRAWLKHSVFWLTAGLSWLFMLVSTAVYVVPPEEATNPFWGDTLPLFKNGLLAVSAFPLLAYETFIAGANDVTWSSFNLGELAFGLRGKVSLMPLLLLQCSSFLLAFYPAINRSIRSVQFSLLNFRDEPAANRSEDGGFGYFYAFLAVVLVYLFRIYPWELVPGWESQFRPLFDPVDMDVFLQRGQWAVSRLKPYTGVFAEYPIIPVLLFGGMALITSNLAFFQGILFSLQILLGWPLFKRLCLWEPRIRRSSLLLVFLPSTLYFSLNRFDLLVSIVLGFILLFSLSGAFVWIGVMLGVLVFVKWAPVLVLPALVLYAWRSNGKSAVVRLLGAFAATVVTAVALQYLWFGWEGLILPLQWQAARNPNEGSLAFLLLWLLKAVGVGAGVRQLVPNALTALALASCLVPLANRVKGVLQIALSMILVNSAFILFSKVYSPQWLVWNLVPWAVALALLAKEGRLARKTIACVVGENIATYLFFPIGWDLFGSSTYLFLACAALHVLIRGFVLLHVLELLFERRFFSRE